MCLQAIHLANIICNSSSDSIKSIDTEIVKKYNSTNGCVSGGSKCCSFLKKKFLIFHFYFIKLEKSVLSSPSIRTGTQIFIYKIIILHSSDGSTMVQNLTFLVSLILWESKQYQHCFTRSSSWMLQSDSGSQPSFWQYLMSNKLL